MVNIPKCCIFPVSPSARVSLMCELAEWLSLLAGLCSAPARVVRLLVPAPATGHQPLINNTFGIQHSGQRTREKNLRVSDIEAQISSVQVLSACALGVRPRSPHLSRATDAPRLVWPGPGSRPVCLSQFCDSDSDSDRALHRHRPEPSERDFKSSPAADCSVLISF